MQNETTAKVQQLFLDFLEKRFCLKVVLSDTHLATGRVERSKKFKDYRANYICLQHNFYFEFGKI
jgi:hypothetical protein